MGDYSLRWDEIKVGRNKGDANLYLMQYSIQVTLPKGSDLLYFDPSCDGHFIDGVQPSAYVSVLVQ
jgi:hypothetical protein